MVSVGSARAGGGGGSEAVSTPKGASTAAAAAVGGGGGSGGGKRAGASLAGSARAAGAAVAATVASIAASDTAAKDTPVAITSPTASTAAAAAAAASAPASGDRRRRPAPPSPSTNASSGTPAATADPTAGAGVAQRLRRAAVPRRPLPRVAPERLEALRNDAAERDAARFAGLQLRAVDVAAARAALMASRVDEVRRIVAERFGLAVKANRMSDVFVTPVELPLPAALPALRRFDSAAEDEAFRSLVVCDQLVGALAESFRTGLADLQCALWVSVFWATHQQIVVSISAVKRRAEGAVAVAPLAAAIPAEKWDEHQAAERDQMRRLAEAEKAAAEANERAALERERLAREAEEAAEAARIRQQAMIIKIEPLSLPPDNADMDAAEHIHLPHLQPVLQDHQPPAVAIASLGRMREETSTKVNDAVVQEDAGAEAHHGFIPDLAVVAVDPATAAVCPCDGDQRREALAEALAASSADAVESLRRGLERRAELGAEEIERRVASLVAGRAAIRAREAEEQAAVVAAAAAAATTAAGGGAVFVPVVVAMPASGSNPFQVRGERLPPPRASAASAAASAAPGTSITAAPSSAAAATLAPAKPGAAGSSRLLPPQRRRLTMATTPPPRAPAATARFSSFGAAPATAPPAVSVAQPRRGQPIRKPQPPDPDSDSDDAGRRRRNNVRRGSVTARDTLLFVPPDDEFTPSCEIVEVRPPHPVATPSRRRATTSSPTRAVVNVQLVGPPRRSSLILPPAKLPAASHTQLQQQQRQPIDLDPVSSDASDPLDTPAAPADVPPWSLHLFARILDSMPPISPLPPPDGACDPADDAFDATRLVLKLVELFWARRNVQRRRSRRAAAIAAVQVGRGAAPKQKQHIQDQQQDAEDLAVVQALRPFGCRPLVVPAIAAILYLPPGAVDRAWRAAAVPPPPLQPALTGDGNFTVAAAALALPRSDLREAAAALTRLLAAAADKAELVLDCDDGLTELRRLWEPTDEDLAPEPDPPFVVEAGKNSPAFPERKYVDQCVYLVDIPHIEPPGCDCASSFPATCINDELCSCLRLMEGFAYNLFVLRDRVTTHVYECMPWCGCTAEACQNRVVSGAKTPIADMTCVFWASKGRGEWDAMACRSSRRDIIRGEYIGNFVGECISAADARRRESLHAPGNVHSILWLPGGI
ncbi:hypothetical protein HK405_005245, partial [Cladochytrium tenue]